MTIQDLTLGAEFRLHWQMTPCERFALQQLLTRLRPDVSLEIGTYQGGSLQVLSHFSKTVISVDIDPAVAQRLSDKFGNVEFRTGDSGRVLPDLIKELNERKVSVGFVLIDGDHSAEGVRRDIEALLELQPQQQLVIILHDSFNPACRKGMQTANWAKSSFVHSVELDFIPGIYHYDAFDTAEPRSMWGGFGCAILSPEKRVGTLLIQESQKGLHEAVKQDSRYRFEGKGRLKRHTLGLMEKFSSLVSNL